MLAASTLSRTVLIVDDDDVTRAVVGRVLEDHGFRCAAVADGEKGVSVAFEMRPDVIVMDVEMPKLDGGAALAQLRQDFRTATTPVIFLTGNSSPESISDYLAAGADDYIVKPVSSQELTARIDLAIRRAQELRDLNPLTGLPGNSSIMRELSRRLDAKIDVACMHVDVDWFKAYNDRYGFVQGDVAIKATADVVIDALGAVPSSEHFLGHIGGDDFIVVADPALAEDLAQRLVLRFDAIVAGLHDDTDNDRGWIEATDRMGNLTRTPLMSLSIGIAKSRANRFVTAAEIAATASEMKAFAKRQPGSSWAIDRRRS